MPATSSRYTSLGRRAVSDGTIEIPLTLTNDGRYATKVELGITDSQQTFNFTIAANLGSTFVAGTTCTTCHSAPAYNSTRSSSGRNLASTLSIPIGLSVVNGSRVEDNIRLSPKNGNAIIIANQTVVLVDNYIESLPIFSESNSGVLGLGLGSLGVSFNDTLFGSYFQQHPEATQFTYGMKLNSPWSSDKHDGGALHWGSVDPLSYAGELVWSNNTNILRPAEPIPIAMNSDWLFPVESWVSASRWAAIPDATGGIAVIEPLFPHIYVPMVEAATIYAAVLGANFTVQGDSTVWNMPCSSGFSWSVVIGGQTFTVPTSLAMIQRGPFDCEGAIRGWANETQTGYLLGSSFISSVYTVFAVGRNGSSSTAVALGQRVFDQPPRSKVPLAAILGGVLGGVALLGAIGAAIWVYMYYYVGRPRPVRPKAVKPPPPPPPVPQPPPEPKPVEPPKAAKVVKEPKPGSVKDDARSFLRF